MIKYYYRDEDGRIFFLTKEANKILNDVKKVTPMVNIMMKKKVENSIKSKSEVKDNV